MVEGQDGKRKTDEPIIKGLTPQNVEATSAGPGEDASLDAAKPRRKLAAAGGGHGRLHAGSYQSAGGRNLELLESAVESAVHGGCGRVRTIDACLPKSTVASNDKGVGTAGRDQKAKGEASGTTAYAGSDRHFGKYGDERGDAPILAILRLA